MILDGKRIERAEAIEPIDMHVGSRLRAAREMRGYSRKRLSDAMGVSEQQIAKWEGGTNRVFASRLWAAAMALSVNIEWFFEGFRAASLVARQANNAGLDSATAGGLIRLMTPENVSLLEQFSDLTMTQKRLVRQTVAEFVSAGRDAGTDDRIMVTQGGEALSHHE